MSTVLVDNDNDRRKHGKRLTEGQKRAIVAAVAVKGSIQLVANEFGVNRNTVAQLVKSVREVPNSQLAGLSQWKQKLDDDSFKAIERSVNDVEDVHKAGSTGLGWLKGSGVLANEGSTTVNVFVSATMGLPQDWQREYFGLESGTIDVTPTPAVEDDTTT